MKWRVFLDKRKLVGANVMRHVHEQGKLGELLQQLAYKHAAVAGVIGLVNCILSLYS